MAVAPPSGTTNLERPPEPAAPRRPRWHRSRAKPPRPRRRRLRLLLGLAVLALLTPVAVSYVDALTYPGSASWQVRSVEWLREHGGASLVNAIEQWQYTHHKPARTGPPSQPLPHQRPQRVQARPAPVRPPVLPLLPGVAPLAGEGAWSSGGQQTDGRAVLQTAWFRPDPGHTSVVAGVAWMDQSAVQLQLVAGTREPGGSGWPDAAQIPPALRPRLLAAFNSGFKMADAHGGFYENGRVGDPLRDGAASLVIDTSGRARIAVWGQDAQLGPTVAAVRQNLHLIVDNSQPVPGMTSNANGTWGTAKSQFQYTWRSGIGADAKGNLVYVGGDGLTLQTLAEAMAKAGVVRGMELDIHPQMVTFNVFNPAPGSPEGVTGAKLLPAMTRPATRYLQPDQRDFFMVTVR